MAPPRRVLVIIVAACELITLVNGNPCGNVKIRKRADGTKVVRKSFVTLLSRRNVTRRKCKANRWSGLTRQEAYEIEVSVLERLRGREVPDCPGRYVPKLLARYDQNLTFVQTWDGVPLSQKYPISEFNKKFCDLPRDYVSSGVDTNY